MNIAEKHTYNLEGILQHMPPGADSMKSSATSGVVSEKRLSRVSVLRDMFQNGIVHPIDDIDERGCNNECLSREDPLRFLRTFPGSPPLSALRNHRSSGVNCATHGSSHDSTNSTKPSLLALKPVASRTKSPSNHSPIPPIRPPKPRFLSLGKTLGVKSVIIPVKPASSPVRSEMEVSSNDNPIVGLPGSPVTNGDNAHSALVGVTSLTRPALTASVVEVRESVTKTVTNSASDEKSAQPCSTVRSVGSTNSEGSRTSNERGNDGKNGMTPLPRSIPPTTKAPELTGGNTSADSEVTSVRVQTSPILSDQKATPELADSLLTEPGILQDFILQSDAFHTSPHFLNSCAHDDSLPPLQHAEPIAVATPDNDEESEDEVDEHRSDDELVPTFSAEPTLPVPPGLKVVAVDLLGVHILEDGNFFYSVPGLPEDVSSILDNTDILNVTQTARIKHSESGEDIVDGTQLSEEGNVNKISGCLDDLSALTDSDTSLSRKTHVRFSTEPIMVFSTHSTTEYNRRNEDIDPLAASAEYELEKHLEEMELFNVDLKKGPQGLGISILGLGVDNVGGDQKLGIFIKSLTPGGAAEANGNIEVFDQVVEVDGTSLVGVSQQFAAQTLRNTHDIVHFVLAREKDPANSRVAQLLAEQQDEERMQTCSYNNSGSYSADNVPTDSLSRDDSLETLHKLMAEAAETAARSNAESLSDNELGDVSLSDAPSHADRGGNNDGTEFGSNPMFSPDSVEIDDEHPADRLIHPEISPAPSSSEKCGTEKVGPRSALKGTATAASTKRRQEAIVNLIHLARQRTKLASSRQEKEAPKTNAETDDSGTNEVVWVLANELYDSNNQLSKLASQLRTTEQLLTAQEAAADEAIERLCRQCRHVEMELNQAREQIKSLLRAQCDGQTLGTDCSLRAPPDTASFQSNGVDGALNDHLDVQSTGLNTPVNVIPGNISSDNGEGQSQPQAC
ncbi:unnamed protein product [Calicophoron daubneyi]|uniref:PDZ domain-containing protein n=1 Tax=Calicophoron daubneyi TaxID=300641 RepID=A0AAV2TVS0_CALDB